MLSLELVGLSWEWQHTQRTSALCCGFALHPCVIISPVSNYFYPIYFFMAVMPSCCSVLFLQHSALMLQEHPAFPGEWQQRMNCCVWGGRSALRRDRTDVCASLLAQRVIFTGSRRTLRSSYCWFVFWLLWRHCWRFLWEGTESPSSLGGQCGKKEHKFFRNTSLSLSPAWDIKVTQFVFHCWNLRGEEVPSFTNSLHNHSKLPE